MNLKLKNADYSQNKIDVIADVVTLKKTNETGEFIILGSSFSNGQTLHFRVRIDDAGTMSGQSSYPIAFGVSTDDGERTISAFEDETFSITIQNGNVVEGNITISKLTDTRIYFKQGFFNAPTGIRSVKWTLQYYIV